MCGIVGYIGQKNATPIILNGLKRLEYRGYDSAGLAVIQDGRIEVRRDVGKLSNLAELVSEIPVAGNVGIGHTRWATHGEPSARNAHPHTGIGLVEAAKKAMSQLRGAHGIVLMSSLEPDKIVAARIGNAGGVVIGLGDHEMLVASDLPAILEHTRRVAFLESRQIAILTADGLKVQTLDGKPITYREQVVAWDPISAEKGEYRHFMFKEINRF